MIIGISGKKQHGKDTIAKIIEYITDEYFHHNQLHNSFTQWQENIAISSQAHLDYQPHWTKKQFAGKLKEVVALIIGCKLEQLEDNSFKEKELGEEWRVWYWSHYKYPHDRCRISSLYLSKEEAEAELIDGKTIPEYFGTASRIETYVLTPRLLLQYMATNICRNIIHPNIWINATITDYKPIGEFKNGKYLIKKQNYAELMHDNNLTGRYKVPERPDIPRRFWGNRIDTMIFTWYEENDVPTYPNWIITDVRFPNEVKAIKDRGGVVIRVNRDWIGNTDNHPSETALDDYKDFDYIISNNGKDISSLIDVVKNYLISSKIL